ncbi:MAG: ABC transporter ATP-binding protein [Chloroflexi bacterium]|nr:ABC transporter ATP-binding protein [Chloroflexota bacterium]
MDVALHDVSVVRGGREVLVVPALAFAAGRATAILGPNGAGKSTLLRTVAGLERPRSGSVSIGGQPARSGPRPAGAVAYAFQQPVFLRGTVRSNFHLALRLRGVHGGSSRRRIDEVAAACGIEHLLDRDAHDLSGGEGQRANLARALSLRAPVTLLDEPLSGIDGPVRRQLLLDLPWLLRDFAATTLLVTHELEEALRLAEDLVVVLDGKVHAAGPKAEVVRRPADQETAAFLGFTILPRGRGAVAVPPGMLRAPAGESGLTWEMSVTGLVDLGTHREVAGMVAGMRVSARWDGASVTPGERVTAGANPDDVVRFGA